MRLLRVQNTLYRGQIFCININKNKILLQKEDNTMEKNQYKNPLVENTTGAEDPNVASTDSNITVGQMFQQTSLPSLGRSIFEVIPTQGPTSGFFNLRKKAGTNNFELVRRNVEVFPSESIATGLTQEVVQDIRSQYGVNANAVIGKLLRGLANEQENARTLEFLEANAKSEAALTLTAPKNAETITFEIGQKVHELILKANTKNQRTYDSWAVIPYKQAASFAALNNYVGGMKKDEAGLFISQIGNTKFYMNPNAASTTAYVGLRDFGNPNVSSGIFSPYMEDVIEATNPDTGNPSYFIFNRFAIAASPLHVTDDEMLFKFNIS